MEPVFEHKVTANVRIEGTSHPFESRPFWLMLGADTPERQAKEAKRVLHQIGWDCRQVNVVGRT